MKVVIEYLTFSVILSWFKTMRFGIPDLVLELTTRRSDVLLYADLHSFQGITL
jgi:hypothetical protein